MIDVAIILAAGRGTRLKEVTMGRSKGMAPIAGSPMVVRVLDSLRLVGVTRFLVVTAAGDYELKNLCTSLPGVEVREQAQPLGSGDALRVCEGDIQGACIVSACDSLLHPDDIRGAVELFHRERADVALTVQQVSAEVSLESRSVLTMTGHSVRRFIEKPGPAERISDITSLPLWVFSRDIWGRLQTLTPSPRGEYELTATFNQAIMDGKRVVAHVTSGREDLTDIVDFLHLNRLFLRKQSPAVQVHPSVVVPASARLIGPVLIGEGSVIGEKVTIGPEAYLEQGVSVAAGVTISESVVTRDVSVHESLYSKVQTRSLSGH